MAPKAGMDSEVIQAPCFYDLDQDMQSLMLEGVLGNRGNVVSRLNGMCGDIFVLDQGANVTPRYVCAKVPRRTESISPEEASMRFVGELELQLGYYHHAFVHWCFDLKEVLGVPVALFRFWGADLRHVMPSQSVIEKLSLIAYSCSGLMHCYRKWLVAHQDLKPANIFVRDVKCAFPGLPPLDIYKVALVADFGLANASINSGVFEGSRPYMSPEQWAKSPLSEKTDVFALGVILHELLTDGYHPAGLKTADVWPAPAAGQSKKWTRAEAWRKWIDKNCPLDSAVQMDDDARELIQRMLSPDPNNRPSMASTRESVLGLVKDRSGEAHHQLQFLLDHFDGQASQAPIDTEWPHLAKAWKRLKLRFG